MDRGLMNRLAGTSGLDARAAANVYAGTTGLDMRAALNVAAGTTGLDLRAVMNRLAGTTGLDANAALQDLLLNQTLVGGTGLDFAAAVGANTGASITAPPAQDEFMTAVLATTPWGLWGLDEASGNALDISGNAHDATWSGTIAERQATGTVPGVSGRKGVRLDGSTGNAFAGVNYAESRGTITLMGSFKTSDTHGSDFGQFIGIGDTAIAFLASDVWVLWANDATSSGSQNYTSGADPDGNPGLVIAKLGANLFKLWIDGGVITSTPAGSMTSAPVVNNVRIGAKTGAGGGRRFTGTLGPVAIWNRGITDQEADDIYAAWAA